MPLFSPMRASRASSFALSPTGSSIPPRTFGDCIAPSIDMKKNRSFFRSTPDSQGFFSRASTGGLTSQRAYQMVRERYFRVSVELTLFGEDYWFLKQKYQ